MADLADSPHGSRWAQALPFLLGVWFFTSALMLAVPLLLLSMRIVEQAEAAFLLAVQSIIFALGVIDSVAVIVGLRLRRRTQSREQLARRFTIIQVVVAILVWALLLLGWLGR